MIKRICHIISFVFMTFMIVTSGYAEIAGPGWMTDQAPMVSPAEAQKYYSKTALSIPAAETRSTLVGVMASTEITDEIRELARALQNDPKLIYDYVHNHIDYVPYFGALKGAGLTLLDRSGNDFDQASLMIALLRESGYTADYIYGEMNIPGPQVSNWLGVNLNATVIGQTIASGGIPILGVYANGDAVFNRVWVKANINGTDYLFDPAFKQYTNVPGIDMNAATGYNRTTLISSMTSGATVTSSYIQNANTINLNNKLQEYSSNLMNTIKTQYPGAHVKEIIGGRDIVQDEMTVYQTTLPYVTATPQQTWADIPATYIATLRIQHVGINHIFQIPDITGKRLTMTYAGTDHHPELRLDGALIASGTATTIGTKYDMIVTMDHPYAANGGTYLDQTSTYDNKSGATYALISNFGSSSAQLVSKRQKLLNLSVYNGDASNSESVLGETLNVMGLTWMREARMADEIMAQFSGTVSVLHHALGRMAQEEGYYIDVKTAFVSLVSKSGNDTDRVAQFNAFATIASSFEHGILEQLMGISNPGISTIKMMHITNTNGNKVFFANSSNYGTIRPQLINYSTATLDNFQSQVSAGYTLIIPENGLMSLGGSWQGTGYVTHFSSGSLMSIGMIISGGYYGGYSSNQATVDSGAVTDNNTNIFSSISKSISNFFDFSNDPVNLATGDFIHDRTDLALGGPAPRGLAFTRSYNSADHLRDGVLGYGWNHNYEISMKKISDASLGLGQRLPLDAVAMLTHAYIAVDLMKNQNDSQGWLAMMLGHKWAVDELTDNVYHVKAGSKSMNYVELPDGSFSAPEGLTTKLVDNGNGTFSLKERFGGEILFNADNTVNKIFDVDGNELNFTYTSGKLTQVRDAFGRTLTLGYTADRLTSVSDSTGRGVAYGQDINGDLTLLTDADGDWDMTACTGRRHSPTLWL